MKKLLIVLLVLLATGCTTRTQFGQCVGVLDDKDPTLLYDLDIGNVFIGFIFSETLIVPAVVVLKQLECPVAKK